MKLLSAIGIVCLSFVVFIACNKHKSTLPETSIFPDSTADVYIAGYYGDSITWTVNSVRFRAMYWKNGNPVVLTDGTYEAKALSVEISGNDVYVVGWEFKNNTYIPMCWKNGVSLTLPDNDIVGATATSVVTSGNDVYVCGFADYTGGYAKYWKNGTATMLTGYTGRTEASNICLDGSDVYVCGSEALSNKIVKAVLWKNGNTIPVNDADYSGCSSMAFNGNDLYLAGYQLALNGTFYGNRCYPKYWFNGIGVLLDTNLYGKANKLIIADNDVYIAGYRQMNATDTTRTAVYWKNGIPLNLPVTTGPSEATGIAMFNNSLYIVGYLNNKGVVWLNGNIFTTMDEHTYFTDIKVVPK